MSKKTNQLMMNALAMGMVGNPYEIPERVPLPPTGTSPSDRRKCKPKALHEFVVKGCKIMATSKKDAIKRYKHSNKQQL
jgi:hypothetical protein